jgi:hypothetical protein
MKSRFDDLQGALLASVRDGLTLDDAATRAGVSVNTVRGWVREGRKNAEGRFAPFAAELDAARVSTVGDTAEMSWTEFESYLAAAVRAGSTTAMKLYADLHGKDRGDSRESTIVDSLAALDELAAARKSRRGIA